MMKTDMKVIFYKAGKADAILVKTEKCNVMIDTGLDKNADDLVKEMKVSHLDALIITHYDKDHVGGADVILKKTDVDEVLVTYRTKDTSEADEFRKQCRKQDLVPVEVKTCMVFEIGDVLFEVFPARKGYRKSASNNSSLIVRATMQGKSFLFTGDAETDRIRDFLETADARCDVLKVPWHGRMQTGLEELIAASSPLAAVITDSSIEPDSTTVEQTVAVLEQHHARVYETKDGTVAVIVRDGEIFIRQSLQ